MDEAFQRQQALSLAQAAHANKGSPIEEILADADKVFAWLKNGSTSTASQDASQHESFATVNGQ